MNRNLWVSTQILLLYLTLHLWAAPIPGNVTVHIWEGNVTVTWEPPLENPGDYLYRVQVCSYPDSCEIWSGVPHCDAVKVLVCNIGRVLVDSDHKVRVGAFMVRQRSVSWSVKHSINIRRSHLAAPTFTLSSTADSVRVRIHRKQILEKIFTNGVQYTTYLWPAGQKNQTLIKSDEDDEDGEITFLSLKSLQEYCVRVKVESTATDASNVSSVNCIKLRLDWTPMVGLLILGLVTTTASLALLICFLRRAQKLPSALKHVSAWKPMIIPHVQVETVTDKGWIIVSDGADTKKSLEKDSERRGSLDSGVSIEHLSISSVKTEQQTGDRQVDSGCGSLKGTEGSGDETRQLSTHETHSGGKNEGGEDSGLGLGHHEGSVSLDGEDPALLNGVEVKDGYRNQSPLGVDVLNDSNMAAPSAGYRSGQVTCTCSEQESCIWCKFENTFTRDCESKTRPLTGLRQTTDTHSAGSSYSVEKSLMETLNLLNVEVQVPESVPSEKNCTQSSGMFCLCPLQDITHTGTFRLQNMELTFS